MANFEEEKQKNCKFDHSLVFISFPPKKKIFFFLNSITFFFIKHHSSATSPYLFSTSTSSASPTAKNPLDHASGQRRP